MVEPISLQHKFVGWPLHITIVPWFPVAPEQLLRLHKLLEKIASRLSKIQLTVGGEEKFGPSKDLVVHIIEPHRELQLLHNDVLELLEAS
jgi:2'-5' RNA ligase